MKRDKKKTRKKNDFFFVCKHIRFSWGLIILALVIGSAQSVITSMVPDATANLFDGDFSTSKLLGVAQTLTVSLILGLVSYAGIFMTSIRRFLQKDHRDVLLTGIAAAAVSYMAYNFFCYQQICCTPFMFMLMGIGEYLYQDKRILEK